MQTTTSKGALWTGRVLSGLFILFMAFDSAIKLADMQVVRDAMKQLEYPVQYDVLIGAIELVCLALYVIPRTAVLGAVLLTGVMGGAIATHLRMSDPLFSHTLFGVYLGVLAWVGLYLRDGRVRALLVLRRGDNPMQG
jgi:hypothetical protein